MCLYIHTHTSPVEDGVGPERTAPMAADGGPARPRYLGDLSITFIIHDEC